MGGRRAHEFYVFRIQGEPRSERHGLGQQDGLLVGSDHEELQAAGLGVHQPEGPERDLQEEGQIPAGAADRHPVHGQVTAAGRASTLSAVSRLAHRVCFAFRQRWEDPEGVGVRRQRGLWLGVVERRPPASEAPKVDLLHPAGRWRGSSAGLVCCD